jgi:aspartyl-tRNA(Asn)/glutamyl-tRNA(Gln) amidotransferase subunit A
LNPFKGRVPEKDAEVVAKLKAAGAIVVGKTNMHQLAMGTTSVISHFGSVHNPWNRDYIAGGSSGGSAAALAAGLCYATREGLISRGSPSAALHQRLEVLPG